jgi:hypothetical protein
MMAGCENVKMGKAWLPPRLSYALRANPVSLEKSRLDPDITDAAGNPNTVSTSTDNTVTVDRVAPRIVGCRSDRRSPEEAALLL